jgi:glycosyltransferase involved in cell wall biosynthesis
VDLLAEERDVDGLVLRLERLIDNPDWVPLCARLRDRVEKEFDASIQGRRLLAIYQGLIQQDGRRVSS